jgi:hypothetical protein
LVESSSTGSLRPFTGQADAEALGVDQVGLGGQADVMDLVPPNSILEASSDP